MSKCCYALTIAAGLWLVFSLAGASEPPVASREGVVREVQLIDVTELGDSSFLIVSLTDGTSYLVPDQRQLAAGRGVKIAIDYLPAPGADELGRACRIRVLGIPITVDGEEVLQRAERPFEIFSSTDPACAD